MTYITKTEDSKRPGRFTYRAAALGEATVEIFTDYAYLEDIWVSVDARGRGVAQELLEAVEADCRARGITRIGCHPKPYERNEAGQIVQAHGEEQTRREAELEAWYARRGWFLDTELSDDESGHQGTWTKLL